MAIRLVRLVRLSEVACGEVKIGRPACLEKNYDIVIDSNVIP